MCKKYQIFKNAHFLNKRHICFFKHCLQMFMHIISIKYGPAAAGIIGALDTGGVQTDIEVPVLLKWQGTTEEERLVSSTRQEWDSKVGPLFLKTSWHQELRWNLCFSTKVLWLHVWSAVSTQLLTNLDWNFLFIFFTTSTKILSCLSIYLHLTKDNLGVKMLSNKRYRCQEKFTSALFLNQDRRPRRSSSLFNKKYFVSLKTTWLVWGTNILQLDLTIPKHPSKVMAGLRVSGVKTDLTLHCSGVWGAQKNPQKNKQFKGQHFKSNYTCVWGCQTLNWNSNQKES